MDQDPPPPRSPPLKRKTSKAEKKSASYKRARVKNTARAIGVVTAQHMAVDPRGPGYMRQVRAVTRQMRDEAEDRYPEQPEEQLKDLKLELEDRKSRLRKPHNEGGVYEAREDIEWNRRGAKPGATTLHEVIERRRRRGG
jgi:hypothetical protein